MSVLPLPPAPTVQAAPPAPPALPGGLALPFGRAAIRGLLNLTPPSF